MKRRALLLAGLILTTGAGCTVDLPGFALPFGGQFPLAAAVQQAQRNFERLVADPLGSKPFPVLIGGDSERIFYATNLGDIRINLKGPSSDFVLPGLLGPSNLYREQDKQRNLLRPLLPAGTFSGLATDGEYVAYVEWTETDEGLRPTRIIVETVPGAGAATVFDVGSNEGRLVTSLSDADRGRVAFLVRDVETGEAWLRCATECLIQCLREGRPTDMDVYDAAAWSAVCALSEHSVAHRSRPKDFPDFTRGRWKTRGPLPIVEA